MYSALTESAHVTWCHPIQEIKGRYVRDTSALITGPGQPGPARPKLSMCRPRKEEQPGSVYVVGCRATPLKLVRIELFLGPRPDPI